MVSPQAKREGVRILMSEHDFGVTRACGLVQISRSLFRYCRRRTERPGLLERIEEIAALKRRYGYRRVYLRLRREGWSVNRKRVYRIYREAGLAVRRRKRKRIGAVERKPLPKPVAANLSWSMDFVSDGLADGRRLRCLTVVDATFDIQIAILVRIIGQFGDCQGREDRSGREVGKRLRCNAIFVVRRH